MEYLLSNIHDEIVADIISHVAELLRLRQLVDIDHILRTYPESVSLAVSANPITINRIREYRELWVVCSTLRPWNWPTFAHQINTIDWCVSVMPHAYGEKIN